MNESAATLRFERKFVPPELGLEDILARLRCHPALFREVYPPRAINNLYWDSPELRNYHEHVQGCAHRLKLRLRWYGPLRGEVTRPVFECKFKRGQVSGKLARPLPGFAHNGSLPHARLRAALETADLPGLLRERLHGARPVLVNRYRRRYFASADGRLRLTLDTDLEFFDARHPDGLLAPVAVLAPRFILELKYPPEHAEAAAAAASELPFRLVRCSKYVLGVEHLPAV